MEGRDRRVFGVTEIGGCQRWTSVWWCNRDWWVVRDGRMFGVTEIGGWSEMDECLV